MSSIGIKMPSFSKVLSQGSYLVDITADFMHDTYLVSGDLLDRGKQDNVLTGILEAKHAIYKTKRITNIDASGYFQLRLQPGAKYHLQFHVDGNHFSVDLDLG